MSVLIRFKGATVVIYMRTRVLLAIAGYVIYRL